MRLQARATNFSIEIVDGVIGSKVSYKAIPYVSHFLTSPNDYRRRQC